MKKVLVLLSAVAFVACFSSCKKGCTCTTYKAGEIITIDEDVIVEEGKECADMGGYSVDENGYKTGAECK